MRDVKQNWVKPKTIEKETKTILNNLLEFLIFSDFFFKEKFERQNIYISDEVQFKMSLMGNFKQFNELIF